LGLNFHIMMFCVMAVPTDQESRGVKVVKSMN